MSLAVFATERQTARYIGGWQMDRNVAAYEIEARLLRWGESSTAGRTITLELDPDAGETHPFKQYPSGTKGGQRFRLLFMPLGDDEVPVAAPPAPALKSDTKSLLGKQHYAMSDAMEQARTRAALLCKDAKFQLWASAQYLGQYVADTSAEEWLRDRLGITSRSEIASNERAYRAFLALEQSYKAAMGLAAEPRS